MANKPFLRDMKDDLNNQQVIELIEKVASGGISEELIMHGPPVTPKGGEMYIFVPLDSLHENDYSRDQYRWISRGNNKQRKWYAETQLHKRYFALKDPNGKGKQYLLTFRKQVWQYMSGPNKHIKIIQYLGDHSVHFPTPHGNSKSNRSFIPSTPSLLTECRKQYSNVPRNVYSKLHSEASVGGDDGRAAVTRPRNVKQVQNIHYSESIRQKIGKDEIFSTLQLAEQTDFVRHVTIYPDLVVFAWSKELLDLGKDLIKTALQDSKTEQMFAYDTTFNLGDFYMSTFVMRNTIFEMNPIFPVAFMIHERKFQKYHELFLGELVSCLNLKDIQNIPFVTDREKGIINAVKKVAPYLSLVLCGNHILKDIEYWVKSAGGKKDDVKVLKDHVEQLKNSESVEEWRNKYEEFRMLWSYSFIEYFENNLHEHIFKFASRFYTKKFPAFQDKMSTNNASESMNKILKNATEWKELSLDSLLLCLLHLQLFYLYEFQRAYYSLGMYTLKKKFKKLQKVPNEYTHFPLYLPVEKIVEKVKSENPTMVSSLKKESVHRMTQTAIANLCIENNLVSLNGQLQVFVVKSPFKNEVHSVCLSPKPKCSCKSTGLCFHLIAVQKASGIFIPDNFTYSLSSLRKRVNRKEGKSGRKKARKKDYDYQTEAAPDSQMATHANSSQPNDDKKFTEENAEVESHAISQPQNDNQIFQSISCKSPTVITLTEENAEVQYLISPQQNDEQTFTQISCKSPIVTEFIDENVELQSPKYKSTPKKADSFIVGKPWHENIGPIDNLKPCLKPKAWLEGEVIECALMQLVKESVISSCCFAVPPHFFHSVSNGGHASFVKFADTLSLLNYDVLLFPINSDLTLYGRGLHWFLTVADLKSKTVTIIDSLSNEYNTYCAVLQKMLYCIHTLCPSVEFLEADWTWILSADCPKQSNSYDCGVHVILNSYIICNGLKYVKSFDSNKVRQWIHSKILQVDYSYLTSKQTTKHTFVAGKMEKYRPPMVKIAEQDTQEDMSTFPSRYCISEGWTFCSSSYCFGDADHKEKQILCVMCRNWYHQKCGGQKGRPPTYFICLQCKIK